MRTIAAICATIIALCLTASFGLSSGAFAASDEKVPTYVMTDDAGLGAIKAIVNQFHVCPSDDFNKVSVTAFGPIGLVTAYKDGTVVCNFRGPLADLVGRITEARGQSKENAERNSVFDGTSGGAALIASEKPDIVTDLAGLEAIRTVIAEFNLCKVPGIDRAVVERQGNVALVTASWKGAEVCHFRGPLRDLTMRIMSARFKAPGERM